MNIDEIADAIERDAGTEVPGLREGLAEMQAGLAGRTYNAEQLLVKAARERLGLSQQAFADLIETPVATLRDWEQGRYAPPGAARCLLEIALRHPEVVTERAA
ncbi:MAG: helix-turn-helix domain-containing protein [Gammaproteobacteria bacterium]|nr:helix-turn-helix domain-containing protein [Gammaproteobacteria bacterium]